MIRKIIPTMRFFSVLLFLVLCSGAQAQDIYFYNATFSAYKVVVTLPNGANESGNLSDSKDSMSYTYFNLVPGIAEVKIELQDEQGQAICSGTAKRNQAYTFFANGQNVSMVATGFYGGSSPQSALFMNSTGEAMTVDLFGSNGIGSVRGIVPPSSFDQSKPVQLDSSEPSYSFQVTSGGATVSFYNDNSKVEPGRYYLIRKDARGLYRLETLGNIAR